VIAFSELDFPSRRSAFGLSLQSAWLRHTIRRVLVALFNNQPMGFYSIDALGAMRCATHRNALADST